MVERLKGVLAMAPAAAMVLAAAVVWLKARQGEFNSMMSFPLVFAGIATLLCVVALFVGRRSLRMASAGILCLAAVLAWGAVWSHHGFFERQRETLDRHGREAFVGETVERIPYVQALNTPGADLGEGVFEFDKSQVLINIWATWCSPCVQEMPMLQRFWAQHTSGVDIVGVTRLTSRDPAAQADELMSIAAFLTERGVSYPILVVDDEAYDRFQAQRLPTSLWIENGRVQDYRVTQEGTETLLKAIEARLTVIKS